MLYWNFRKSRVIMISYLVCKIDYSTPPNSEIVTIES